jgi:phage terminase small subunit
LASRRIKAPEHLAPATRRWWAAVHAEYALEEHHSRLLTLAAEAWDLTVQTREALAEHGVVFVDRLGTPRARPEVAIERDARLAFARLLRELDLDVDPPAERSRPPALRSNRRP